MRLPLFFSFILSLLFSGCGKEARFPGEIPTLNLKSYHGENFTLSAKDGKVTLLVFWATWCQPCLMEIPTLIELHQKLSARGFRVVSVNVDDPIGLKARAILLRYGVNYPALIGNENTPKEFGGIQALPTSLLIGRDGKLKEKFVGLYPGELIESKVLAEL